MNKKRWNRCLEMRGWAQPVSADGDDGPAAGGIVWTEIRWTGRQWVVRQVAENGPHMVAGSPCLVPDEEGELLFERARALRDRD